MEEVAGGGVCGLFLYILWSESHADNQFHILAVDRYTLQKNVPCSVQKYSQHPLFYVPLSTPWWNTALLDRTVMSKF